MKKYEQGDARSKRDALWMGHSCGWGMGLTGEPGKSGRPGTARAWGDFRVGRGLASLRGVSSSGPVDGDSRLASRKYLSHRWKFSI